MKLSNEKTHEQNKKIQKTNPMVFPGVFRCITIFHSMTYLIQYDIHIDPTRGNPADVETWRKFRQPVVGVRILQGFLGET